MAEQDGIKHTVYDGLFRITFRDDKYKRELGGALTTPIPDDAKITPLEISRELTAGIVNDLSFLVDNKTFIFVEAQTTKNPNMPLRILLYVAEAYNQYLKAEGINLNTSVSFVDMIPTPRLFVVYDGVDAPGETSTSEELFGIESDIYIQIHNITSASVASVLCDRLREYFGSTELLRELRAENKDMAPMEILRIWQRECRRHNYLVDIFDKYGKEIDTMILSGWTPEMEKESIFYDGLQKGKQEGKAEERAEVLDIIKQVLRSGGSGTDILNAVQDSSQRHNSLRGKEMHLHD